MDQVAIGKCIRENRLRKGFTQEQLAEQLGITGKAVSKWENAKSMPEMSIVLDLCRILGITVDQLLSSEREESGGSQHNGRKK